MALMLVYLEGVLHDAIIFDNLFDAHDEADRWGQAMPNGTIFFHIEPLD